MKLILHLKQLSLGHYILFLGDKWTGCATEESSTKEMRQCKQACCKPPTASLAFQHCCHQLLSRMIKVSSPKPQAKQTGAFFPFHTWALFGNCRPPRHSKNGVRCWVGVGSSYDCLPKVHCTKQGWTLQVFSLWLSDVVQSKQAW